MTSSSSRIEIACFVTGVTTRAPCQKSSGSARSSAGAVRAISASVVRRKRARSARPFVGVFDVVRRTGFADGFGRPAALLTVAESGADDPTHHRAVRSHSVSEDDRQRDLIGQPERHDAALAVVPTRVMKLDLGRREDLTGELKVESAQGQLPVTFRGIPVGDHRGNLRLYIHRYKKAGSSNNHCSAAATANQHNNDDS